MEFTEAQTKVLNQVAGLFEQFDEQKATGDELLVFVCFTNRLGKLITDKGARVALYALYQETLKGKRHVSLSNLLDISNALDKGTTD